MNSKQSAFLFPVTSMTSSSFCRRNFSLFQKQKQQSCSSSGRCDVIEIKVSKMSVINRDNNNKENLDRRDFLRYSLSLSALPLSMLLTNTEQAKAVNGLRILPLREPLTNNYYLMRACETYYDSMDLLCVNPVEKLSIEKHGLTKRGVKQAENAAKALETFGIGDESVWLWPSVTISAFETAEVLSSMMRIRRDKLVPEYSFLDARGVGNLEGGKISNVKSFVHDHDSKNSDWKPQPADDGTPNDSVNDVFVRVRQLFSKLETQYFDQDIIVIAPDSDPLSIWQAAIMGMDLKMHPTLSFAPGEIRQVKEVVVDIYGNVVNQPSATTLFKPA